MFCKNNLSSPLLWYSSRLYSSHYGDLIPLAIATGVGAHYCGSLNFFFLFYHNEKINI